MFSNILVSLYMRYNVLGITTIKSVIIHTHTQTLIINNVCDEICMIKIIMYVKIC